MKDTKEIQSFKGLKQGAQGDVLLTRVDSLPKGLELAGTENGMFIVAHSETGHNHAVIDRPNVELYNHPLDPLLAFLVVNEATANLTHFRGYDQHKTVQFDKGVYRINRQREHTPDGLRRVAD